MSKVDDELTRRLRRAERPVDTDALFEVLELRRSHRERVRRVQAALLAFAVLAATVGGFAILTRIFDPDRRDVVGGRPFGSTGAIVTCADETGQHLCRIDPDALARGATSGDFVYLTDLSGEAVAKPAVSPDGATVVFERFDHGTARSELWTIRPDGTDLRRLTRIESGLTEASWGPTGLLVAIASYGVSEDASLAILDPSSGPSPRVATIDLPGLTFPSRPRWSPDNQRILFSARASASRITDLYTVAIDGSKLTNITNSAETEYAPSWSPDGRSIAFWVGSPSGDEIRICPVDCSTPRPLSDPEGRPIYGALPVWSPDGNWIASPIGDADRDSAIRAIRIDGTEVRTLATPAGEIAWIPVPAGGSTPSPQTEPEGRDIGLGFNLCDDQRLSGIDFLGDGTAGTAWIGVPTNEDGTCPRYNRPGRYVVAEDHTEDGVADSWLDLPWRCDLDCVPFDATDLDANGTEELVVASYFSIMDYYVMGLQPNAEGALEIRPLLVAEPGHEPVGLIAGKPLRIDAGGDEGYGSQIECEGYPDAPVLTWSWSNQPVETNLPREAHITRLQLRSDGLLHVVATNDYAVPAGQPSGIQRSTAPACGVDFHPNA
jgi:hypothetical protein